MERWRIIPNFSNYEASDLGSVRNKKTKYVLSNKPNSLGYVRYMLTQDDSKRVSKLASHCVLLAFIGKDSDKNKNEADHINRNPSDNRLTNLRWACRKLQCENRNVPKNKNSYTVLKICPKTDIIVKKFDTIKQAAFYNDVSISQIKSRIINKTFLNGFLYSFEKIKDFHDERWKKIIIEKKQITKRNYKLWISNYGRVKDENDREQILVYKDINRYTILACNKKFYPIHVLVATYFIPNPDDLPIVNHKDSNMSNNHFSNLEWTTRRGNSKHAWDNGSYDICKKVYKINIDTKTIENEYNSVIEAAKKSNITGCGMSKRIKQKTVVNNCIWSFVNDVRISENIKNKPNTKVKLNKIENKTKPSKKDTTFVQKNVYKFEYKSRKVVKIYKSLGEASRTESCKDTSTFRKCFIDKIRNDYCWSCNEFPDFDNMKKVRISKPVYKFKVQSEELVCIYKNVKNASEIEKASESSFKDRWIGRVRDGFTWSFDIKPNFGSLSDVRKNKIQVQKLEPHTNVVIQTFDTIRQASENANVTEKDFKKYFLDKGNNVVNDEFIWKSSI